MQNMSTKVWVRMGDQDEYENFDHIESAAVYVHKHLHPAEFSMEDCRVRHTVIRCDLGFNGIILPKTVYQGDNGISFYWGDVNGDFADALTDCEFDRLRQALGGNPRTLGRTVLSPNRKVIKCQQ